MNSRRKTDIIIEQGVASYIDFLNQIRILEFMNNVENILVTETQRLSDLALRQSKSLSDLDWAKEEIVKLIDSNRGGVTGKHGFIAESAETGITNARRIFEGLQRSTVNLNNNGPADLLVDNKEVQMKFMSDLLSEIRTSSYYREMKMMFPKDHVEVFEKIMDGEKNISYQNKQLSDFQIINIKIQIENESKARGEDYTKWIKSSSLNYKDVHEDAIAQTLSNEFEDINKMAKSQKSEIESNANKERIYAQQKSKANIGEATKVAVVAAGVQGGVNLGLYIYEKHKSGQEIWEFTAEDWRDSGIEFGKGALKGGISGYAIYGLTNVCQLSAPSAGAIASGTFGLANSILMFRTGQVDEDGFIDLVTMNAIDATGAAIGAAIGQTLIPVPVVGAVVGSIVATTTLGLGKDMLNKRELKMIEKYQNKLELFLTRLDDESKQKLNEILSEYSKLGDLQKYSFDAEINTKLQLVSSISLARYVGVNEKEIMHDILDIDNYFIS